ncbi:chorismate mutase [Bifidobacterium longum]|uniref:chorismate mutase n=1 Tax=Bifidobacterium longum TaxID=216816 RepID=UPI0021173C38|nr:chorismate mutase [Bifidobacterium longum]
MRSHIDAIDDQTIALIGGRGQYAVQASAFKKDEEGVRDTNRMERVIAKVRGQAERCGANPDVAEAIYREIISRVISMGMREFHDQPSQTHGEA